MPPNVPYKKQADVVTSLIREQDIETEFLTRLDGLKYILRPDIRDRVTMEQNFREKFESLNRVRLTDAEFARFLDEIVTSSSPNPFSSRGGEGELVHQLRVRYLDSVSGRNRNGAN